VRIHWTLLPQQSFTCPIILQSTEYVIPNNILTWSDRK
jgi:hypothetical protein